MYTWNDGSYLAHHGIKGQKWGVRKYQNEDGSLTAAGRARYGVEEAKKAYKQAKREYRKADARRVANEYNYSNSYIKTPGMRAEIDRSREEAQKKAAALNEAKSSYKNAKKEYHQSDEYKEKMKKVAVAGAAMAATALAAYGAYKLSESIKDKAYAKSYAAGKDAVSSILSETNSYLKKQGIDYAYSMRDVPGLNASVSRAAANNSRNLARAVQTLKGNRQFSVAELERAGVKTAGFYSKYDSTENLLDTYRRSKHR